MSVNTTFKCATVIEGWIFLETGTKQVSNLGNLSWEV